MDYKVGSDLLNSGPGATPVMKLIKRDVCPASGASID